MKIADLGLLVSAALVALLCCGRAEDDPQSAVPGDGILALNGSNYDLLRSNQDAEWIILLYNMTTMCSMLSFSQLCGLVWCLSGL